MCIYAIGVYAVAPFFGHIYGEVYESKIESFVHLFSVAIILLCTLIGAILAIITRFKYSMKTIFIAITHGTFYFLILLIIWQFLFK